MIRIEELYRLHDLCNLRLIAGESGVSRRVTAAVLFEYDPSRMQLADFYRGDLVVTTLAYARGDEELVQRTLVTLMNQGVAGLLIKTAYFKQIPAPVLTMANRLGTPIFLFDDTYIEEVILAVTELIRGSRHFAGYEQEIEALMSGSLSGAQARERVHRIDPVGADGYVAVALYPRERMPSLEDKLYDALYSDEAVAHRFVCMAWRRMMLVLCRLKAGEQESRLDALLSAAGLSRELLCIGESAACDGAHLGTALCEAVYAARAARMTLRTLMRAQELGPYAYLLPMSESAFIRGRCEESLRLIREYDAQNRASLEATAAAYVDSGMQIAQAAKALFQHPNTVRYRLSRIKTLLGIEDDKLLDMALLVTMEVSRIAQAED